MTAGIEGIGTEEHELALFEAEVSEITRAEVLEDKLRRTTRCVIAITDEEFAKLYPNIVLAEE